MSFSLYYKSMFLKVGEDKYLPMFETAESNVWSANNPRKRSRDWGNTRFSVVNNKLLLSEKELLEIPTKIEENIVKKHSDYNSKSFGFYYGLSVGGKSTSKTTFNDYKSLFKNGINNAITFDILKTLNISIYGYKFEENGYKKFSIKNEDDIIRLVETEPNIWFSFLNLKEEKYKLIKAILSYKSNKNNTWLIKTNLGFIKSFDNKLNPIFTNNEKESMLLSNSAAKALFNAELCFLYKGINEVNCREQLKCYR